ncbi:MAG: Fic family protein [Thiotrichales bacterium]|nr:Fic family protein [Thiotrichales bacterium]
MTTAPPYTITPAILDLAIQIGEALGRAEASAVGEDLHLRRINRIRSIRGSLAIEGNTLTEDEITTLLDGRPVIAPPREIREVRNAFDAYHVFPEWDPTSEADLLRAHEILMSGLLDAPGRYRRGNVAVAGAGEVHHIGPPADRVPHLMGDLLSWVGETDEHPLITSSIFHYEFEFIHPFEDGNGRMGRLWQTLILTRWNPLFAWVPVESLIYARQSEYYEAIRASSAKGEGTSFITYMLEAIHAAVSTPQETAHVPPQVTRLLSVLKGEMSARQILHALGLRDRKSFRERYLLPALEHALVEMTHPESPRARNQRYRLTARGRAVAR